MATNPNTIKVIEELRKSNNGIWKRVADDISKPTRQRREVNLSRLDRYTKDNEVIVVPGKVLGGGAINHPITIAAFSFSGSARKAIEKSKGKILEMNEIVKQDPKKVRIIG